MPIDFTKFGQIADSIKKKVDFALSDDGKVSENELKAMKLEKEAEAMLRQELRMNRDIYDENFVITKKEQDATYSLKLDKGKTEGVLKLTEDSLKYYSKKYPNIDIKGAYLINGTVYLTNSNGKMVLDDKMQPIKYSFRKEEEQSKVNLVDFYLNHNNGQFDLKKMQALQKMQDSINSQPEIMESYEELMQSIEFDQADKEGKIRMMFEQAKKNLAQSTSINEVFSNLFSCVMLNCQVLDYDIGIVELRQHFNEFLHLDDIANLAREWADDGNDEHLSEIEQFVHETIGAIKGAEEFMTSTQLVAFACLIGAAATCSEAAGIGELFAAATTLYFGYETGSMAMDSIDMSISAKTPEEAEDAGKLLGTAIMMGMGVAKGGRKVAKNVVRNHNLNGNTQYIVSTKQEGNIIKIIQTVVDKDGKPLAEPEVLSEIDLNFRLEKSHDYSKISKNTEIQGKTEISIPKPETNKTKTTETKTQEVKTKQESSVTETKSEKASKTKEEKTVELTDEERKELKANYEKFEKYKDIMGKCLERGKEADEAYEQYLNEEFVSDNPKTDAHIKDLCRKINQDFGVKVFLPSNMKEIGVGLKLTYQTLAKIKMHAEANGGELNLPPTINPLNIADVALKNMNMNGVYNSLLNVVSIKNLNVTTVIRTLIHELTHANDTKRLDKFPDGFDYDWAVRELSNAGISSHDKAYSFTNPQEMIAVAAQGKISAYSTEFKQVLVSIGMPAWMLTMP